MATSPILKVGRWVFGVATVASVAFGAWVAVLVFATIFGLTFVRRAI